MGGGDEEEGGEIFPWTLTALTSKQKSRIRETPNLSTDADSSTAAKKLLSIFFVYAPPEQ